MWTKGYRDLWHWAAAQRTGRMARLLTFDGPVDVPEWEAIGKAVCGALVSGHEAFETRDGRERTCVACRRIATGALNSARFLP